MLSLCGSWAHAAPITWIGGDANWDAANGNWNPADEPDADDEAIFNSPDMVSLAGANFIQALTLSGGIDLDTNGTNLTVNGLVQLAGSSTTLIVRGNDSSLMADSVTINSGGSIRLTGGSISISEESGDGLFSIHANATLTGNGVIGLGDNVAAGTTLLNLGGGTLTATSDPSALDPFGSVAATLSINVIDPDGRVDLDNGLDPTIQVNRNDTLDINGRSHDNADPFDGLIHLAEGATLDMGVAWEMGLGGIDVSTASIVVGVPGSAATIAGAQFTMNGGAINLESLDRLRFSAPFQANSGNIVNAGKLIFAASSTIGAGANLQMTSVSSSITVNAGAVVNIDDPNFDADGLGTPTNVITIHSGGILDLDLGAGADESLTGTIQLNGGELDVTTSGGTWSIDGVIDVGSSTGTSQINGDAVTFTSTFITVGQNSTLDVNAASTWAGGNLVVNAGATARIDGPTTFEAPGSFTGNGTLQTGGAANFAAVTTINMSGGTVDLDGNDLVGNTVTINANTTINAGTMANFGTENSSGTNTLVLNEFANLTVNLTGPNAEWTLTAEGVLDINAAGGNLGGSGIQGSDFNMAGLATISGNSLWGARTDISGTVSVTALGSVNLCGGDLTSANVNRLEGGTITGVGALRALADEGLFGFGVIDIGVEFDTNTELRADNGVLTVNGPIVDMGVLGTADADGILNRPAAWSTAANIDKVDMRGGEIRGGTISNDNVTGINGFGLLSAPLVNNTSINARHGGTLIVETASNNNDWDGTVGNGQLNAVGGTLEIRDNAPVTFAGTVSATNNTFHAKGFDMTLGPTSTVSLIGGMFKSTNTTHFAGTMTVGAGADSTIDIQVNRFLEFQPTSVTTLDGSLRLVTSNGEIQPGATFSGSGALNITAGSGVYSDNGVNINVLVDNDGTFGVGGFLSTGRVDVRDYQQSSTGALPVEIAGTGLNQFDRLFVTGAASLAGALDLALLGGFVPAVGDAFNVVSATGGVAGVFTTVNQPSSLLAAGREFDIVYNPTFVQLIVSLTGDYNRNGVVDAADYALWRDTLGQSGLNLAADGNNSGTVDDGDYDIWKARFGATAGGAASAADLPIESVPEPSSITFIICALVTVKFRNRARRPHAA